MGLSAFIFRGKPFSTWAKWTVGTGLTVYGMEALTARKIGLDNIAKELVHGQPKQDAMANFIDKFDIAADVMTRGEDPVIALLAKVEKDNKNSLDHLRRILGNDLLKNSDEFRDSLLNVSTNTENIEAPSNITLHSVVENNDILAKIYDILPEWMKLDISNRLPQSADLPNIGEGSIAFISFNIEVYLTIVSLCFFALFIACFILSIVVDKAKTIVALRYKNSFTRYLPTTFFRTLEGVIALTSYAFFIHGAYYVSTMIPPSNTMAICLDKIKKVNETYFLSPLQEGTYDIIMLLRLYVFASCVVVVLYFLYRFLNRVSVNNFTLFVLSTPFVIYILWSLINFADIPTGFFNSYQQLFETYHTVNVKLRILVLICTPLTVLFVYDFKTQHKERKGIVEILLFVNNIMLVILFTLIVYIILFYYFNYIPGDAGVVLDYFKDAALKVVEDEENFKKGKEYLANLNNNISLRLHSSTLRLKLK